MVRRVATALLTAVALVLTLAAPASAATRPDKATVLSNWTQTSAASYQDWNAARLDRAKWSEYNFNWSTDLCSSSPDQPLGFDFRLSCTRHDFGYRNYKEIQAFPANKSRLDNAFHEDMRRACRAYRSASRPACNSLAWTYYNAVRNFGSLVTLNKTDLDRAATLLP